MLKQILDSELLAIWPLLGTVLAVSFMGLVLAWIIRPGAKAKYRAISHLVFEKEEVANDELS